MLLMLYSFRSCTECRHFMKTCQLSIWWRAERIYFTAHKKQCQFGLWWSWVIFYDLYENFHIYIIHSANTLMNAKFYEYFVLFRLVSFIMFFSVCYKYKYKRFECFCEYFVIQSFWWVIVVMKALLKFFKKSESNVDFL